MDIQLFEKLIQEDESKTLDDKIEFYDFTGNNKPEKEKKQASFIKDILAFSNTIREESAHIIFGVEDKTKKLIGINKEHDGNELATVLKSKLNIIPEYHYENFRYNNLIFGVLAIPIKSYRMPCKANKDIGSKVKKNTTYLRRDQSIDEATYEEERQIIEWFKSLEEKGKKENNISNNIVNIDKNEGGVNFNFK